MSVFLFPHIGSNDVFSLLLLLSQHVASMCKASNKNYFPCSCLSDKGVVLLSRSVVITDNHPYESRLMNKKKTKQKNLHSATAEFLFWTPSR